MYSPIHRWIAPFIGRGDLATATPRHFIALGLLGVIVAAFILLVIRPVFWAPSQPAAGIAPMPRRRVTVVYAVMALILGGSLLDAVRDSEHWPWSCYPMYSFMETGTTFDDYRLYGVPTQNPGTEISLFTDERYLQPFDQSRLAEILNYVKDDPRLHDGLVNCLTRYEALRHGGRHDGPELAKLRMYHVFWTLDPWGATIEKPDRKELVEEVALHEKS
jgi:hypothetical protein